MINEVNAYKLAGALLIVNGLSHVSQLLLYETTTIVKIAASFGGLYFLLGVLALKNTKWLPGLVVVVCTIGLAAGTRRLIEGPFNLQFAAHQLIHLVVITTFLTVILQRRKKIDRSH